MVLEMDDHLDIPLFDDNPTTTDRLGFSTLVEITVEALTRPALDPVCVGITGPWGSGKSSIVQQVEQSLSQDQNLLVVYVEPWAFDPNSDPKAHVIGDVLNAISERVQGTQGNFDQFMGKLKGLLSRVRWARALGLAATTALTAQLPHVDQLAGLFGPQDGSTVEEPSIDGFRDDFADLMNDEVLQGLHRVVVVVDDLDRCLSDTVIDVLEAIKLFLSVPKMAFLIAADETAVRGAISSRYGNSPEASKLAERYLDKIVQIPVRVPVLDLIAIEAYILQLLALGTPSDSSDEADRLLRDYCDSLRNEPTLTLSKSPPEGVASEHVEMAQRLAPLLHVGLDGNPRRVKRFLNEMGQRERLARSRGIDVERNAVAKLMVLEQVQPNEFNRLLSWVRSDELEQNLSAIETDDDTTGALAGWSRMPPEVDAETVRRYILLAASLRGEVVAVHSLPEHLRDMASALTSSSDSRRGEAWQRIKSLSVEDAAHLGRYVAEAISSQTNSQADHAESIGRLAQTSETVADAIATEVIRIPAEKVDPALVIALAPPRKEIASSIRSTLEAWQSSGQLSRQATKAVDKALRVEEE